MDAAAFTPSYQQLPSMHSPAVTRQPDRTPSSAPQARTPCQPQLPSRTAAMRASRSPGPFTLRETCALTLMFPADQARTSSPGGHVDGHAMRSGCLRSSPSSAGSYTRNSARYPWAPRSWRADRYGVLSRSCSTWVLAGAALREGSDHSTGSPVQSRAGDRTGRHRDLMAEHAGSGRNGSGQLMVRTSLPATW